MSWFITGTKEAACLSGQQNNVLLSVIRNKCLWIFGVAVKTHSSKIRDQYWSLFISFLSHPILFVRLCSFFKVTIFRMWNWVVGKWWFAISKEILPHENGQALEQVLREVVDSSPGHFWHLIKQGPEQHDQTLKLDLLWEDWDYRTPKY